MSHHVLILQHPQEQDEVLGSVPLLMRELPGVQKRVGLSWPSFSAALGHEDKPDGWVVLYPSSLKRELTKDELSTPVLFLDRHGEPVRPERVRGVIALDGTWSQAKALWWRNPWMLKLGRVIVHPKDPSIYGRLRKEPKRTYVSTLEAVALVLDGWGHDPEITQALRRIFRQRVQKVRDGVAKSVSEDESSEG
jgi:DTW domain-containing protein